ncbi:hypothetical protein B0H11DRAFT_2230068 [Mycena galericulata]|nr:hypothetical protein B0H11DRAFT_2230068 [Mycena galericulata]
MAAFFIRTLAVVGDRLGLIYYLLGGGPTSIHRLDNLIFFGVFFDVSQYLSFCIGSPTDLSPLALFDIYLSIYAHSHSAALSHSRPSTAWKSQDMVPIGISIPVDASSASPHHTDDGRADDDPDRDNGGARWMGRGVGGTTEPETQSGYGRPKEVSVFSLRALFSALSSTLPSFLP